MKNKNKYVIFLVVFVVFLLAAMLWLQPEKVPAPGGRPDQGPDIPENVDDSALPGEPGVTVADSDEPQSELAAFLDRDPRSLPSSLRGTDVDGGVRADDSGRLIVESGVRRMFEYFLSTLGEASLDDVKTWVAHYLNDQLPASAAAEGWALFNRYLSYRESLGTIADPGPGAGPEEMRSVFSQRNALRREILGQEAAEAFFAEDEAYDRYMLRQREIAADESLSEAERARRLEQARAELPVSLQETRRESTRPVRARETVEQMRADGASEAEVRAWREAELGPEAADRLEALEQSRREWDQRYRDYQQALQRLDTEGLAEQDRQAAVQRLREARFDEDEIRRVEALDRIRQDQGGERADQ